LNAIVKDLQIKENQSRLRKQQIGQQEKDLQTLALKASEYDTQKKFYTDYIKGCIEAMIMGKKLLPHLYSNSLTV